MCTVVLALTARRGLVVVANRDERLDRPSQGPLPWPEGFVAPRDVLAGGSWLGVNRHGVFVAITNRAGAIVDANRTSRGGLVTAALQAGASARAVHDALAIDPVRYNGFHLLVGDDEGIYAMASDGLHLARSVLGHGVHVITERSFGAGDDGPRRRRIEARWGDPRSSPASEELERLLTDHDEAAPFDATCIHVPGLGYGTRSAMVYRSRPAPAMAWADGPPCTTRFTPVRAVTDLLAPGF